MGRNGDRAKRSRDRWGTHATAGKQGRYRVPSNSEKQRPLPWVSLSAPRRTHDGDRFVVV